MGPPRWRPLINFELVAKRVRQLRMFTANARAGERLCVGQSSGH